MIHRSDRTAAGLPDLRPGSRVLPGGRVHAGSEAAKRVQVFGFQFGSEGSELADMIAVCLLPVQFARAVGLSKQTVSNRIRTEKVMLDVDGRLGPVQAIKEVLKNAAPTRLRAGIFRQAIQGGDTMRAS